MGGRTEDRHGRLTRFQGAFAAGWALLRDGRHERVVEVFADDIEYIDHRLGPEPIVHDREALLALWGPVLDRYEIDGRVVDVPGRNIVLTEERYVPRDRSRTDDTVTTYGVYTIAYGRIARGEFFATEADARAAVDVAVDAG